MKTHVAADDARPAGKPGECFYCKEPVGKEHKFECVIPTKRVRLRITMEYETDVPRSWGKDQIEFHHNESSWCLHNAVYEIQKYVDSVPENTCVLCADGEVKYLRDVEIKELA